jgi:hypothetical protein
LQLINSQQPNKGSILLVLELEIFFGGGQRERLKTVGVEPIKQELLKAVSLSKILRLESHSLT